MNYMAFLASYCGCCPDSQGNMPCDNGVTCNRCMTPEMQKAWEKVSAPKYTKADLEELEYAFYNERAYLEGGNL